MRHLWFLTTLLFAGYAIFARWFFLIGRAEQWPLVDVYALAPTLPHGLIYLLIVSTLFLNYWLAYRFVQQHPTPPARWLVVGVTLLFGIPLVLTYPINAVDVFRYWFEGRMIIEHGANPLTMSPNVLAGDPMLPFAAILLGKTSPYGPLWELVGALLYWLSRGSVTWGLILFKSFGLLCHVACGLVVGQILCDEDARTRTAQMLLWLWNPALLFMFVMDAHNDSLMLLCLLLGYWSIQRQQRWLGLMMLVLAPLVKPIGVLPLPLFAVMAWRQLENERERMRLVIVATVGALLLGTLAFLPFGSPLPLLHRLRDEAQTGASFSPVEFVIVAARMLGTEVPVTWLARNASLLFMLIALLIFWRTWQGRSVLRGTTDIFAAYLVTALKFRIWYPTWLLPWIVLQPQNHFRLYAVLWLLLLSQLSVVFYAHVRVEWLGGSTPVARLIGVPLVYGAPLVIAWVMTQGQRRDR